MPVEDNAPDLKTDFALLEAEESIVGEEEVQEETPKVSAPKKKVDVAPEETVEEVEPETEEETEEPRELLPHERPSLEQIRKEFPEFFKKFPTLKDAFFREKQFSEIYHTPQEAKEAADLAEEFSSLRQDIVEGTGEALIPALKVSESLPKFAKNFLPNLYKADKDLHWQVVLPIIEDMVRLAYGEGNKSKNDNLKWGAYYVSQFLLGDAEVAEGKRTLVTREEAPKKDSKLEEERNSFENHRFNTFNIDVRQEIYNSLLTDINKGFKQEDGLTPFMKKSITDAIVAKVNEIGSKDTIHQKYMIRLWLEAKKEGYRDKSRIINASLARAKDLIPKLRRQLIAEALGSSPLVADEKRDKLETANSRREPGAGGRPSTTQERTPSAKKIDWKRTSDVDFLNGNYKTK